MLRAQQWQRKSENVWRLSSELGDGWAEQLHSSLEPRLSVPDVAARQNPEQRAWVRG